MRQAYNAVLDVRFSNEAAEPITVASLKSWLKIDLNDDDFLLGKIIPAARLTIERYVNLSLVNRTVTAKIMNGLGGFVLPYGPVKTISTVTDFLGVSITNTIEWNILNEPFADAKGIVTYEAGFERIPPNLEIALMQQCAYMYENRGDESAGDISPIIVSNLKTIRKI